MHKTSSNALIDARFDETQAETHSGSKETNIQTSSMEEESKSVENPEESTPVDIHAVFGVPREIDCQDG